MASRAADNLRSYFHKATLPEMLADPRAPEMPPPGQRSQYTSVRVTPEPWRQLTEIRSLGDVWAVFLEDMARAWADEQIPKTSLGVDDMDGETGERVIPGLDYLPLMTVQRLLHLVFPTQTANWTFSLVDRPEDTDRKVYQQFLWSYLGPGKPTVFTPLGHIPRYPLAIAFQPPWILSTQDMLEFSACREFPRFDPSNPPALESKERLWAKVWDTCVTHKTRWFVLTSYSEWVFGVFSDGWTIGFTSAVYAFDARNPTILELLAFWVACAMRLPGWRCLPAIRESLTSGPPRIPVIAPTE
ncbi:hypothetical protein C8R46DRAFT_1118512 [Mycena filopes]|nr:hypothetical protein C8R46DRAFT_1118512 [Mycena filopes]